MQSRTIREGSVGLFAILGLILLGGLVVWLRGGGLGRTSYQIQASFEDVSGLQLGAPVNYRGVTVGRIAGLMPGSNEVNVILEIDSTDLKIPRQVKIQANRYGLIGEASVDITPLETLSEQALKIDPHSEECGDKNLILCDETQLQGESGSQLIDSLTRLSEAYSDPRFIANINETAKNAAIVGKKIAKLADEMTLLTQNTRQEIRGISETTAAIQGTANRASGLIENLDKTVTTNQKGLQTTIDNASTLVKDLNETVTENRANIRRTLIGIEKTTNELQRLALDLDVTVNQVNSGLSTLNTTAIAENIDSILANTSQTSANLRQLSDTLNDPANIIAIQKTLDSARATFENTQKITADVEELIGDPVLRNNLRKMINGLSDLVSSTEQLEQQVVALKQLNVQTIPADSPSVSVRLTPFVPSNKMLPIHPKTTRYQLAPLPKDQNRLKHPRFLTQVKED